MHDKKIIREEIAPALEAESSLCDVCKIRPAIHKLSRPLLVNTLPSFENLCNICKKRRDFGRTGQSIDEIADSNNLVSVLKVDGDDVGEIISGKRVKEIGKQPTPSRISTISRLIHESCESELSEVVQKNGGLTIYAGGDDILAILPGNKAFNTAIQMQETFSNIMGSSASISAGLSVFNYKIPIYVGLETAIERLKQAKNNEGKSSVSFDVLFGVAANSTTTRRAYKWPEFKELLEIVDFMGSGSTTAAATATATAAAMSQMRTIVSRSIYSKTEAELLIKYNIGRNVLNRNVGEYFLKYLDKGILTDAFIVYNIVRGRKREI